MSPRATASVCTAFLLTLLAVGIPYWRIPYSKVALPHSLVVYGLMVPFLAAAWLRGAQRVPFIVAFLAIGMTLPAAVMIRVAVETWHDPTSHNLWPFEIVFAGIVSLVVCFTGTLLGSIWVAVFQRRDKDAATANHTSAGT